MKYIYNIRDNVVMYYTSSRHNESLRLQYICVRGGSVVTEFDAVHAFLSDTFLESKQKYAYVKIIAFVYHTSSNQVFWRINKHYDTTNYWLLL